MLIKVSKVRLTNIINRLISTGFFNIFGSGIIVKIIGFLSSVVLVRMVTKEAYGTFSYAWNIYSIMMLASGFGSLYAVLQMGCELQDREDYKQQLYQYGWNFGLRANLSLGLIMLCVGLLYPLPIKGVSTLLCIMCFLPIIQYGADFQAIYLRSERMNNQFSLANVVNVTLVLIFSIIGSLLLHEKGFVIGRYLAYLCLTVIGVRFWNVPLQNKHAQMPRDFKKDFFHISFVSMLNGGISQLAYFGSVFVLGIVVPDESVIAAFRVATTIPTALSFIPAALVTYIFPYFVARRNDGVWCLRHYSLVTLGMALLNGLICIVLSVFAEPITIWMYGLQYIDAVGPFRILLLNYFVSGTFRTISGNLLVTQRKLGFNSFIAIVSGILNIVAVFWFIPKHGSIGTAYAILLVVIVSSILNTGYLIFVFWKKRGAVRATL